MPESSESRPSLPSPADGPDAGALVEQTIVLPKHLHARPAWQIAQAAARHQTTTIELTAGARQANARSVLAVMAGARSAAARSASASPVRTRSRP
jgi:phosphotransferase system HPr-like phosphotransfer protein